MSLLDVITPARVLPMVFQMLFFQTMLFSGTGCCRNILACTVGLNAVSNERIIMAHFATQLSQPFTKSFLKIRYKFATGTVNLGVAE